MWNVSEIGGSDVLSIKYNADIRHKAKTSKTFLI